MRELWRAFRDLLEPPFRDLLDFLLRWGVAVLLLTGCAVGTAIVLSCVAGVVHP